MFVFRRVLTVNTPMGRKAHANLSGHATPLVRTKRVDLEAAGVIAMPRIDGTDQDVRSPPTEMSSIPQTIVWCTGYRDDFGWIEIPGAPTTPVIQFMSAAFQVDPGPVLPRTRVPARRRLGNDSRTGSGRALLRMQRLRPLIMTSQFRTNADLAVSSRPQALHHRP